MTMKVNIDMNSHSAKRVKVSKAPNTGMLELALHLTYCSASSKLLQCHWLLSTAQSGAHSALH